VETPNQTRLHKNLHQVNNLLQTSQALEKKETPQPEDQIEESPGFYRGVIIDALAVISALFTGYVFSLIIYGGSIALIGIPPTWITLLVFLSIFLTTSLLEAILIKNTLRHIFILALQVSALAAFLYSESSAWLFTFLIALGIFFWASQSARMETENSVRIRFLRIAQRFFGKAILAVALMGIVFYFPSWQARPQLVPDNTFDSIINVVTDLSASWYGGLTFNANSKIESVIDQISRSQVEGNPAWVQLPLQERERQLENIKTDLLSRLQSLLGLESIDPETEVREIIRNSLEENVRFLESRFKQWFFWGWVTIMLVVVLGVGRLYGLFMSFFSLLIYELLVVTKFIRVYLQPRNKEILDF